MNADSPNRRFRTILGLSILLAACGASPASPEGEASTDEALMLAAKGARPHSDRSGIGLAPIVAPGATSRKVVKPVFDARRSLAVTDQVIVSTISLSDVLQQIVATSGAPGLTVETLFRQFWDTQNPGPGLGLGAHCDDQSTSGVPSKNGFPYVCPRPEGALAESASPLSPFKTIGFFNRFDLASTTGADCGEHRIAFALSVALDSRASIIFEAVLPNPHPELGVKGCVPVARFWSDLSLDASAASRAAKLREFYLHGLPGFEPVVHADHYGAGPRRVGQIRTNQAMKTDWLLREFQLSRTCVGDACALRAVPATDKVNPFGGLFEGTSPVAADFQNDFIAQVPSLAVADINRFNYAPLDRFNGAQSLAQGLENNYRDHFSRAPAAFRQGISAKLAAIGSSLTPEQIAARAQALSCAGCHQLSNGTDLGGGITWPSSQQSGFTHVSDLTLAPGPDGGRFTISRALEQVFLPHRTSVLQAYLRDNDGCASRAPNCCGNLVCVEEAGKCPIVCLPAN